MTPTNKYFIVAITIGIWAMFLPQACKEKPAVTLNPKEGEAKIIAVYKNNGIKTLDVLIRKITKSVKYDSLTRKDIIKIDTLWGYPRQIFWTDSSGKQKRDSLGRPLYNPNPMYILISKDSVNSNVANISVDSLVKK